MLANCILQRGDVILRDIEESDCGQRYLDWMQDPEVVRFLEVRWSMQTPEAILGFVRQIRTSHHSVLLAIADAVNGVHIGNLKIGPVHPVHRYAAVSYLIGDRSYWGRGCATAAIGLAVQYGFDQLNLNRLQAGYVDGNAGSARALEKNGFTVEGRRREGHLIDGVFRDGIQTGLLKSEWRRRMQGGN